MSIHELPTTPTASSITQAGWHRKRRPLRIVLGVGLLAVLLGCTLWVFQWRRDVADRKHPNLIQLTEAMHKYNDKKKRLPPAALYAQDGKALLSWRVILLPYLGEEALYNRFKLEEVWDSPHNLAMLSQMPAVYAPPPGKHARVPPGHTVCQVFVGTGTAFEPNSVKKVPASFWWGTSNTILIAEGGEPVPWTSPQDIPYVKDQPLPTLATIFDDGFRVALLDGTVRFMGRDFSETIWRKAIAGEHELPIYQSTGCSGSMR